MLKSGLPGVLSTVLACGVALLANPFTARVFAAGEGLDATQGRPAIERSVSQPSLWPERAWSPWFAPVQTQWSLLQRPAPSRPGSQRPAPEPRPLSQPTARTPYVPITGAQRVNWIVDGTIGASSLGVGVIASLWQTAWNVPEEWERSWSGLGKRYLQREADVAISSTLEAGLGAIWGEDPRFIKSQRRGLWPRARYAIKTAFVAPRRDGKLAPAWARLAGNTVNNVIENTWLPPSVTTPGQTTLRSVLGFGTRILGNLWGEFWPDVSKRLFH